MNSCTCILDNVKKQVRYHAAAPVGERPYDPNIFQYIGDGFVYAISGIVQPGDMRLSFFKLKPDRPYWAK